MTIKEPTRTIVSVVLRDFLLKVRKFQNEFRKSLFLQKYEQKIDRISVLCKGLIKSEWIYEVIDFPNYQLKNLKDFCSEIFEFEYLYI